MWRSKVYQSDEKKEPGKGKYTPVIYPNDYVNDCEECEGEGVIFAYRKDELEKNLAPTAFRCHKCTYNHFNITSIPQWDPLNAHLYIKEKEVVAKRKDAIEHFELLSRLSEMCCEKEVFKTFSYEWLIEEYGKEKILYFWTLLKGKNKK